MVIFKFDELIAPFAQIQLKSTFQKSILNRFPIIKLDHPVIIKDPHINWICDPIHTRRVCRGLSGAGKKSRWLYRKGRGVEKLRPSIKAHRHRGK